MSDISSTSGPATTIASLKQTAAAQQAPKNRLDKDAFLKLLVAQLKYQNPLEPMDSSALMAQTSQLTMVEKMESMDASMTESTASTKVSLANGFIGRQVTYRVEGVATSGIVTSARLTADGAYLRVGNAEITIDQIETVATAPTATAPATTAPAS
jgi:flagellar basal-body rod modification protein FlgD